MRKISIIHPTRNRESMAFKTYINWFDKAKYPEESLEYILSVDIDDPILYEEFFGLATVLRSDNKTAIEAINAGAKVATGNIFVVISDDFDAPEYWDNLLRNSIGYTKDFLIKTDDGLQKTLVTLPIMDRTYYERFGYVYHPDYLHMHADEEMTIVALMLGRYFKSELQFPHLHYTTGKSPKDPINEKNDATWAYGQATLDRRALNNFGIEEPLVRREDIVWK